MLKNVNAVRNTLLRKYKDPRMNRTFKRLLNNVVREMVIGRLIIYRSPTIVVHPFVKYDVKLGRSEMGNDSHTTPHDLHWDIQSDDTT